MLNIKILSYYYWVIAFSLINVRYKSFENHALPYLIKQNKNTFYGDYNNKRLFFTFTINLEIDIPNLHLIKSIYWLLIRGWILSKKVRKNFAPICMGNNCKKLSTLVILSLISIVASTVLKIEVFMIDSLL